MSERYVDRQIADHVSRLDRPVPQRVAAKKGAGSRERWLRAKTWPVGPAGSWVRIFESFVFPVVEGDGVGQFDSEVTPKELCYGRRLGANRLKGSPLDLRKVRLHGTPWRAEPTDP